MDENTFALIIQLQLEDIIKLRQDDKGKKAEGTVLDSEVAYSDYQKELERVQMIIHDRRIGHSISKAVETDGVVITEMRTEENNAARDHQMACSLGGVNTPAKQFDTVDVSEALVQKLSPFNALNGLFNLSEQSTGRASSSQSEPCLGIKKLQCVSCQEDKHTFDVAQTPCGHQYCRDCTFKLFEASTTDESLFPPRCCRQAIPISEIKDFLSNELLQEVHDKSIEFSTPNRTYCVRPSCSKFIPLWQITTDIGVCPSCGHSTCVLCKGETHNGECPGDTNTQALLTLASNDGWMRCYSCRRMIELDTGCYHITCLCKAQFCYLCGMKWKTCACPQWDDNRLLTRAAQVIQRARQEGPPPNAQAVEHQIQQAAQNLQAWHDCDVHQWQRIQGSGDCERCRQAFPLFIYRCGQCLMHACSLCRYHRL